MHNPGSEISLGGFVIVSRTIQVKRHAAAGVDVEGRPAAGALSTVTTVLGNLFYRDVTREVDGRMVRVTDIRAHLPADTDVLPSDLLECTDQPGVRYRVKVIVPKPSPFSVTGVLSLDCEVAA